MTYRPGRWGFAVPAGITATGQVLLTDLLSVDGDEVKQYTVHLNALRYQSGQLPIGATQPSDNQTQSLQGSNPPGWKAILEYGGNDARERCVIDYYARGCTFSVHASQLRLAVSGNINAGNNGLAPPLLSGYVTDTPRVVNVPQSPTFTTAYFTLTAAAGNVVPVADRATAYRLLTNAVAAGYPFTVTQADAGGLAGSVDTLAVVAPTDYQQGNRAMWQPLQPWAQFIAVNNADISSHTYAIQYLLDLG